MITLKIGSFPGEIKEFILQSGTTVADALALAGVSVGEEQDITLDGTTVSPSTFLTGGNLLLATKRIKAA